MSEEEEDVRVVAGEKKSNDSGKYAYEDVVRSLTDAAMRVRRKTGGNRDKGNFRREERT